MWATKKLGSLPSEKVFIIGIKWTIDTADGIIALDPYITGVTSDNLVTSTVLYDAVEL